MHRPVPSRLAFSISTLLHSRTMAGTALLLATLNVSADCITTGTSTVCDATPPTPWTSTLGTGNNAAEDNRSVQLQPGATVAVGNANAISLRDNATVSIGAGSTVSATATSVAGLFNTGGNTVEVRSNGIINVAAGGQILAQGTQGSAEAINFQGAGNVVTNSGTIRASNSVAIWSQNTSGLNTVINTETGIIQAPGTVIGGSGNGALDFTNRGQVIGNVSLAGGDDILRLFTGSVITGNFSGGAGTDAIFLSGTGDSTLPGNFVGFEALTKNDSGRWTLSGTITGVTLATVQAGTLALTGNNAQYTGQVVVEPAGTLEARAQSLPPTVTNNGLVRFAQADDGTYVGAINGTGALEKTGAGVLTLAGTTNAGGATSLLGGTLVAASALQTAGVSMAGGTTLRLQNVLQTQAGGAANVSGDAGAQQVFIDAGGTLSGAMALGDGDDLLDLSGSIAGAVDQGGGNDTAILRSGGRIGGTLAQGAGNDRLEVQGGSVAGAATQGSGDDVAVLSAGSLASLDQGEGADSLQVSGGSITGTVQQGNGIDSFLMTDGSIGALLQGDNYDSFRMTGGRIVGAFEDGDYAEMTGGRIGRVNMKLDNNVFDMSGGTIDGNLVTGFGRDTIILSDGYIGGNISVSGGDDSVTLTGGTVRGEIRMSVGNDTLDWSGGGVVHDLIDMGEGDDIARLSDLNESHLGAVPRLDGGSGTDALAMDNVKTTAVARYTGWERIALANDSQMTFDGTLVLGDAGTATGTLDIDATSALFASGATGVSAFTAGSLASVLNAGRIDMSSNDAAGDVFTVNGNYTGNGGGLYLNTVLGDDRSASDRLVISGGAGTGTTGIGVINAGGGGGATIADGILLVQAGNGATTSADAFALFSPVAAGAYEYFLFKGGVSGGTAENWYLRSTIVASVDPAPAPPPTTPPLPEPAPPEDLGTPPPVLPPAPPPPPDVPVDPGVPDPDPVAPEPAPPPPPPEPAPVAPPVITPPPPVPDEVAVVPGPLATPPTPGARPSQAAVTPIYRLETPAYTVVPSLLRTVSQASLGTFHERQGEQRLLAGEGAARAAWGRLIGSSEEQHWNGDALTGFDGDLQGLQAGLDLHASDDGTLRSQWGVFVGRTRATGRITGLALGWENVHVGQARLDDKHVGLSWTGVGTAGGYLDAVVMQSRYRGQAWSTRGLGIDVRGDGTSASLEAGKPLLRLGQSSWWLEPQLQVIWQRQSLDDADDAVAAIRFDADNAWTGRIGLRLAGDYGLADNGWQPYFKLNYWKTLDGDNRVDFGSNRIVAGQETSAWEVGVGVVGRFNRNVSAYAVADYTRDLEDRNRERRSVEGNIGLRFDW